VRRARICRIALLHVALSLGACVYGIPAGLTPKVTAAEIARDSGSGPSIELAVDSHAPPSEFYAASAAEALRESGLFGEVRPESPTPGPPPDVRLYLLFGVERRAVPSPRLWLSYLTLGVIPSWSRAIVGVRGLIQTGPDQHAMYWITDEITLVSWLPLSLVALPDVAWGKLSGRGTYYDRFCRNLVRNIVFQARQDGLIPERSTPAAD
jgi:hypothetical protein